MEELVTWGKLFSCIKTFFCFNSKLAMTDHQVVTENSNYQNCFAWRLLRYHVSVASHNFPLVIYPFLLANDRFLAINLFVVVRDTGKLDQVFRTNELKATENTLMVITFAEDNKLDNYGFRDPLHLINVGTRASSY